MRCQNQSACERPKTEPCISDFMTSAIHTIGADVPLNTAYKIMRSLKVRHLPVIKNEKLVGILSERNTQSGLATIHGERYLVEDAMIPDPFVVLPSEKLYSVTETMAEEKYGCTIVANEGGKVVGIFTTTDACRALNLYLRLGVEVDHAQT